MFNYIIQFIQALNANSKPSQIANSFCIGLILGLMPKNNLLWYVLFVFFMFVRINKAGYFITMLIGACFAYLADPLFDTVGYAVLTFSPLENFYAWLLDIPVIVAVIAVIMLVYGSSLFLGVVEEYLEETWNRQIKFFDHKKIYLSLIWCVVASLTLALAKFIEWREMPFYLFVIMGASTFCYEAFLKKFGVKKDVE